MTSTRIHLLTRCLRLEARIIALQQDLATLRPNRRALTDADRTIICALRQQGNSLRQIAIQTGWSVGTVHNAISEPLLTREVGAL